MVKNPASAPFMEICAQSEGMIDTVVVATDGSESVGRAVAVATDLADRFDAEVHALYVIAEDDLAGTPDDVREAVRDSLADRGEEALAAVQAAAGSQVRTATRTGRPATEIIEYARELDADLVAIGTRGRHGEHRLLLGSVAEEVVRRCPIPVLSVRQLEAEAGSAVS